MGTDLLAHQTCELVVDGVAGAGRDDASLDGLADESHVTYDVEKLVACRFVLPYEGLGLQESQLGGVVMGRSDAVGQLVEFVLRLGLLVDDDGVVEVATLDETSRQHHLDLADEAERTCRSYLFLEVAHVVERSKLRAEDLRLEGNHSRDAELLIGQDGDDAACLVVAHFDFLVNDVIVLGRVLLGDAYAADVLDIDLSRAVEDGHFGTVDLNEAVVDAERVEGCQGMLDRRAASIAFSQHGAAGGLHDILGHGIDNRFAGQVDALDFVAVVLGGGVEGHDKAKTCVQSFAMQRETAA